MLETVGNALSPGAGRFLDFMYPQLNTQVGPTANGSLRLGQSLAGVTLASGNGATLTYLRDATYEMDYVNMLVTATAGNLAAVEFNGVGLHLCTKPRGGVAPLLNDLLVYRLLATMFVPGGAFPLNDGFRDFGFQVVKQGIGRIVGSGQFGWGFQIVDANTVQFISRDEAGLVITPITAAPFDTTIPHCYEMRISSATATTDALLSILIDNVPQELPVSQSSWAVATRRLPANIPGGGNGALGWVPWILNSGGQPCSLGLMQFRMVAAPSILATL